MPVQICGPKNSRYTFTGTLCPHLDLAIESNATTLREALAAYGAHFNATVSGGAMLKGGTFYLHVDNDLGLSQFVDVIVQRAADRLEPGQNASFQLQAGDIVEINELIGEAAGA